MPSLKKINLTEEKKFKFKNIEKIVLEGLHEYAKSITQLEEERHEEYIEDAEQEKFKSKSIWYNKTDLDLFVAENLNLNPNKWERTNQKIHFTTELQM